MSEIRLTIAKERYKTELFKVNPSKILLSPFVTN